MLEVALIFAVACTQLVAGSGGDVYLCLTHDGRFCCIEFNPAACSTERPTRAEQPRPNKADKDCRCCGKHKQKQDRRVEASGRASLHVVSARDAGCKRELIASNHSAVAPKFSKPGQLDRPFAALVGSVSGIDCCIRDFALDACMPAADSARGAQVGRSTVVLRC